MPIRKGKLRKPCIRCESMFEAPSRTTKICDKCLLKSKVSYLSKKRKETLNLFRIKIYKLEKELEKIKIFFEEELNEKIL